ncbi:YpmA family protein [Alicyclobacillus fastidiosus]|uniref:YpmA family protein n=1 Tax=Alicyclobacillus fastidiosus TaxID=392011 RepID=A0ABY6ZAB0_9BACL|nr:YpmA family protein [Alicyclobacillus fastidiosus]WAH39688.1 YpmA family protein [Alicyclobacillus fastidiosus]GMA60901.1 hypothetical protein GCM10025859_13410 [Alicyclobacillus fastidiosus]
METKLHILATHRCSKTEDLYLLVDFLNRNLKDKDIVFGLSKAEDKEGVMQITLYRTDVV